MATPSSDSGTSGVGDGELDRVGQLFDLVTYVALMLAVFGGVSGLSAVAVGGRFTPGVKFGLFVFGWLAFFFGTMKLRPKAAWKSDDEGLLELSEDTDVRESDFQRLVQWLPPARFRQVPPDRRLPTGYRMFLAAVCMMAVSIVLEQFFGVGP